MPVIAAVAVCSFAAALSLYALVKPTDMQRESENDRRVRERLDSVALRPIALA